MMMFLTNVFLFFGFAFVCGHLREVQFNQKILIRKLTELCQKDVDD